VAFIRYNRDRRGYETTVVLHAYRTPQGGQRQRVLYLFRSPSSLQVGRRAFDEEVVEALEHTHPDVAFDWPALLRGQADARSDARVRPRRDGPRPPQTGTAARRRETPAAARAEVVLQDETLLGRVLGAPAAARLRGQQTGALQRIARRARTPEERDRLSEQAQRLNPDEWADEAAVRAGAAGFDAALAAITAELPQRRRGRRGGRHRDAGDESASAATSAIMEAGEAHAIEHPVDSDRALDAPGDDDRGGAESDAPEPAADDIRRPS
jgi:hypothetical protein